jgi:Ca2+-binding EF-hand superfamily protein
VLASELYAQALERKERARLRREARQAAAAAADAAAAAEAARAGGALNAAAMAEKAAKKKKMEALKKSSMVMQAQDAINNKFKDMFKAFQYIDLDHSGTLNEKELAQALDMFNVPLDKKKLKEIIAACDADGDGSIDYKEFVDVLARDTVTIAAMGKRDMQALEAMGVESLSKEFLKNEGNRFYKNDKATINKDYETMMAASANAPVQTEAQKKAALNQARDAINAKFSNMRKAFQDLDLDASGTLSPKELYHAFDRFNLQMDRGRFQSIIDACDKDGNGSISYEEFVDVLARDTVADAAMGKRGLQAIDAMGVESLDKEFLGHKHIKNIKASINNLDDLF